MLIRIWMLVLAIALVLGTTATGASDQAPAEITESASAEDGVAETCADTPARPRTTASPFPTDQDAMPSSRPVAQIFRPPRHS